MNRIETCSHPEGLAISQVSAWQHDRHTWHSNQPVTAALAKPLEVVASEDTWLATATTDGQRLLINPQWSATLTPTQRRQIQEHLVWHAVAGDYVPHHGQDAHLWHLACDHAVNVQLLLLGAELPLDAILFPSATKCTRSEVYDWLTGHPCPDVESPLDQLYNTSTSYAEMSALERRWQQHAHDTVQQFLGTRWLPDPVAAWLLGRR